MKRRNALKHLALLSSGALLTPRMFAHPHHTHFSLAACDWSIRKMLQLDAFHFGKKLGLDGIEYSFGAEGNGVDLRKLENRIKIRETVKQTGVGISSLAIGILNDIPFASTDEGEQLVVECIETMSLMKEEAKQLGDSHLAAKVSPKILLLAFFLDGDINGKPELIEQTIDKLKRIAPSAEKQGFTLGLETWLNEADHRYILEQVGSPAVKVYYDVANSNKMGYNIYEEIESLGTENICQIHCKENGFLLGQGKVDFNKLKTVIDKIGYEGWLVIEGALPKDMDVEKAYHKNIGHLHSVFNS